MKKLVIWDGDETLWKGTLMEGTAKPMEGVTIGFCKELAGRGVLQAVASRNREEDVREVIHAAGLSFEFLVVEADLERPKSAMVKSIMERLNINKTSDVLFVDDSPHNRAEVAANVFGCSVAEPGDLGWIDTRCWKAYYTDEDRNRVARYNADKLRQTAAQAYGGDNIAFLNTCGFRIEIRPHVPDDFNRIFQLCQRANRYAAVSPDFDVNDREQQIYVARLSDKYGDYGIVGFIAVAFDDIKAFIVSCSMAGKGVGSALLTTVLEMSGAADKKVTINYRRTDYNGGIEKMLEFHGFEKIGMTMFRHAAPVTTKPDWFEYL